MVATAQAQSEESRAEFLPMPKTLPQLLFAPDSLAGSMLEPFEEPDSTADAAVVDDMTTFGEAPRQAEPLSATVAQVDEPLRQAAAQADTAPEAAATEADDAPQAAAVEMDDAAEAEIPSAGQPTTVHVIVENVESSSGTVNVAICDTSLTPQGCPYHVAVPASAGFVEAMFEDVPPGNYAVVGYHDVNNNNEFDRFLGIPREPFALSGEAAEVLVPEFEDAVLTINQGENFIIIRMKRLGSG